MGAASHRIALVEDDRDLATSLGIALERGCVCALDDQAPPPTLWLLLGLLALLASLPAQAALPAAVDGKELPSLAPVLERVTPSVVNVYTQTRVRVRSPLLDDPFFRRFFNVPDRARERVSQSLGSGVIVDADKGYVLTNNHVIAGADDISVTLSDGRSFDAEVIGTDPDTDLAMVRIPAEDLEALPFADSKELRVGDFVVAVGNPFGLGQTVTSGIVSALGRSAFRGLEFQNFIQTDASINPGNSGGALINLRGELVGINSAIFTPSGGNVGIGFAIPSAMAWHVMGQLAEYGEVRRGTLGIFVQDLTTDLAGAFDLEKGSGVLVAEIDPGSAADEAGLEAGDVITRIGDYPVGSAQEFHNYEGQFPVDDTVQLAYLRDGGESTTLNCGYGHGYSVREVLDTVSRVNGSPLTIHEEPRRAGDPPMLVARADRVRELLKWTPRHDDLEFIVRTSLEWERKLLAKPPE